MLPEETDGSIVGIGLDLVDCPRFSRLLQRTEQSFRDRVFTVDEWTARENRPDRDPALACCFAAKEALFKAFGTGWRDGLLLNDVTLRQKAGRASLHLTGNTAERARALGAYHIFVSVQYDARLATAFVMLTR
jgi:holo-[acyl-carrier protein] synthase